MQSDNLAQFLKGKADPASIFSENSSHLAYRSKSQISGERNILFKTLSKDAFVKDSGTSTRFPSANHTPIKTPLVSGRSLNVPDQNFEEKSKSKVQMRVIVKSRGGSTDRIERNSSDDRFLSSYTSDFKYRPGSINHSDTLKRVTANANQTQEETIVQKEKILKDTLRLHEGGKNNWSLEKREVLHNQRYVNFYFIFEKLFRCFKNSHTFKHKERRRNDTSRDKKNIITANIF
jgi:hypothetical protein